MAKIDIVLSSYNGESYILEQIKSICSQSYKNFKLIIRDDHSSDNTPVIINHFLQSTQIEYQIIQDNLGNLGPKESFTNLLSYSQNELIVFCDQDDIWNVNKLEKLVEQYNNQINKNLPALIFSDGELINKDGTSLHTSVHKRLKWKEKNYKAFCFSNYIPGCTMMVNQLMKTAYLNLTTSIGIHDYPMVLIALHYLNFSYSSANLTQYRIHENNTIGLKKSNLKLKIKDLLKFMWVNEAYRKIVYYERTVLINEIIEKNYLIKASVLIDFKEMSSKSYLKRKINIITYGYLKSGKLMDKLLILFCY